MFRKSLQEMLSVAPGRLTVYRAISHMLWEGGTKPHGQADCSFVFQDEQKDKPSRGFRGDSLPVCTPFQGPGCHPLNTHLAAEHSSGAGLLGLHWLTLSPATLGGYGLGQFRGLGLRLLNTSKKMSILFI